MKGIRGMIGDIFDRVADAAQSAISSVKDTVQNNGTTKQRKLAMQWLNKGKDCYNTRSYEKAEDFFRRALTEDPAYARAHAYLGNALYKQGRPEEAVEEWQKAVICEPDSDAARKAQEKIDNLKAQTATINRTLQEGLGFRETR